FRWGYHFTYLEHRLQQLRKISTTLTSKKCLTTTGERSNMVIIREETSAMPLLKNKEALNPKPRFD
ncbi:hypothetical protein, partial [uncultured Nostoc sp.]|uniref:hypothetical protein n=1 Tax=uncultured Nostoc sp. TaxID=340711 RepID=UPI0035C95561